MPTIGAAPTPLAPPGGRLTTCRSMVQPEGDQVVVQRQGGARPELREQAGEIVGARIRRSVGGQCRQAVHLEHQTVMAAPSRPAAQARGGGNSRVRRVARVGAGSGLLSLCQKPGTGAVGQCRLGRDLLDVPPGISGHHHTGIFAINCRNPTNSSYYLNFYIRINYITHESEDLCWRSGTEVGSDPAQSGPKLRALSMSSPAARGTCGRRRITVKRSWRLGP